MTGPIERIAIVGTGAMGGMYAAHFARAGFEVELVARGERAERLRAGLTVNAEPLVASVIASARCRSLTAKISRSAGSAS